MVLAIGLLLGAALHDAAVRTIPNWIPTSLVAVGVILRMRDHSAVTGIWVAALLLMVLGVFWLRGFIGGGDAKLIPAVALVLPPSDVPNFILSVAIGGGALALLYVVLSRLVARPAPGRHRGFFARVLKTEAWRVHRRGPIPYAVAIAGGGVPIMIKTLAG